MSIRSLFKSLTKSKNNNRIVYQFTEEDRLKSADIRAKQAELRIAELDLKLARLKAQQDRIGGNGDNMSADNMLTSLIMNAMALRNNAPPSQQKASVGMSILPPIQTVTEVNFTDEQINGILNNFPKWQLKIAKKMDDEQIGGYIRKEIPNISEASLKRGIELLRKY